MSTLDLSPYGFPVTLELPIAFREFPALAAEPSHAPLVFLIDEDHVAQTAIDNNAANAGHITKAFPDVVAILEHFEAGVPVDSSTASKFHPSNFHIQLFNLGFRSMFGGDEIQAAQEVQNEHTRYEILLTEFDMDHRHLPEVERENGRTNLHEQGRLAVRNHARQFDRSKKLIETALTIMKDRCRVGIINAGANHNSQILENVHADGSPLYVQRSQVSFIRLRSVTELRELAAYYHWLRRRRPLWEEMIDWTWAEQNVPGLGP